MAKFMLIAVVAFSVGIFSSVNKETVNFANMLMQITPLCKSVEKSYSAGERKELTTGLYKTCGY